VLYEGLLEKKRYVLYGLSFLCTMIAWREGTSYLVWLLTKPATETVYQFRELKEYNKVFWIFIYWANVVYDYIALGVYLAFRYFRERQQWLEIDARKKELELKQLKEQLNPHFLFNALNNIYSYSIEQNPRTGELLLKLSDLMRFTLQKSALDHIPLEEEVDFIENYIAFEQERLGKRCAITVSKRIGAEHNVPPFIFFTFVENAFKHSTNQIGTSEIALSLAADKHGIQLSVTNTIAPTSATHSTGLGLENVKRRLDILYPGRHTLKTGPFDGVYTASLHLQSTP
jgi:LytS/YehU family sensor histidine kinase